MDRISQLPECIIHQVLSCFDTLDAPVDLVRMSVLSKKWFNLTASFPVLDFSIHNFKSRESFFRYVEFTTNRFCHQNVTADRFKLSATIQEPAELEIINRCLELVLEKGVNVLEINITKFSGVPESNSASVNYRLPDTLLSVSMLKSLTVHGCKLPSSWMANTVKFKSLIRLRLENVVINDGVIKYLPTTCPLLQDFQMTRCYGFKTFCVYGHPNLQNVQIQYHTSVKRIDIVAPNLCKLSVLDMDHRGALPMNLASCEKLTTVYYFGHPLRNSNGFTNFLSNFPFIQHLCLGTEYKCKNLKLSSDSLRTLLLHPNCDLEKIEFNTPNLVLFMYSCKSGLLWPLMLQKRWPLARQSTHLKACMQCYPEGYIDSLWFHKLRLFLDKKNGFKVLNLYIHAIYCQKFKELKKLKAIELPPYELEHVELQLDANKESSAHVAFVDAVLWCCRPRSLTLRSSDPLTDSEDVVKFTYEKLLQQEDEDHTSVQIVSSMSSNAQTHLMNLKSLSMALPLEGKTISFMKEGLF